MAPGAPQRWEAGVGLRGGGVRGWLGSLFQGLAIEKLVLSCMCESSLLQCSAQMLFRDTWRQEAARRGCQRGCHVCRTADSVHAAGPARPGAKDCRGRSGVAWKVPGGTDTRA